MFMAELFEKLGVDWKLLIAQLVNFAILFWILKRFAYKPILGALEKRSKTIEKSLDDAKKIETQVAELEAEKQRVLNAARQEAAQMVERSRRDAEHFAAQSRDQAQSEAQQIVAAASKQVKEMKDDVMAEAKADLADLVVSATEKVARVKLQGATDAHLVKEALHQAEDRA